jgi:ERCC4-related helicase
MPTDSLVQGAIVRLRTRNWLVQQVDRSRGGTTVSLACADDDNQGEELEVVWEAELDRTIVNEESWKNIGRDGFDSPRHFAAYLNTVRWNCVTATDPRLFQSPFRAGIKIDPYQLEPLYKALRLPRVNLFIADDVGLGKTIEAGLIATELLLRRRVQEIVVACPPSMLLQWRDELENRFGLTFEIFDREYVERIRRERGHSVNPWTTFPRFLISHKLLIDETYVGPMNVWLDNLRPGSLLIFDEAHHAAPASGSKYAIDSQITKAVRTLAGKFEHRLFLSATPHNGHSNSFSSLLAILDRERFIPGIKVPASSLEAVMVRRLKDDLRSIGVPGFPERKVEAVELPKAIGFPTLPEDAPELALARLLDRYRTLRLERMAGQPRRACNQFELLITQLQQRLLSSIEAFARTLRVHRKTMERVWAKELVADETTGTDSSRIQSADSDDERASIDETVMGELIDRETEKASLASASLAASEAERSLLDEITGIAEQARSKPDARIRYLVGWIQENMCAGAALGEDGGAKPGAKWTDLRVILFTEWDDTKRYLEQQLKTAIAGTDRWEERIEIFHGPTPVEKKDALKQAFQTPPSEHPIRILICTDAAREGLNLQAYCYNLFHFDVPWNPARLEQRNGRIDRKLQPQPVVYCRYFVYTQRPEDKVLRVLARKTQTIREELGSFNDVLSRKLKFGIRRSSASQLADELDSLENQEAHTATTEELESTRKRHDQLREDIAARQRQLEQSQRAIAFDSTMLRDALSCSLELMKAKPLEHIGGEQFALPDIEARGSAASWSSTLDTLRVPPKDGKRSFEWRRGAPIRPLVFEPPPGIDDKVVQMHLSHRLVQRLLGQFNAQGFTQHELSRACLVQSEDRIPRVILLARLSVYGPRAARLHEELLTVTASWTDPATRTKPLTPFAREAEGRTMALLQNSLAPGLAHDLPEAARTKLAASIQQDVRELLVHLEPRGELALADAQKKLVERGETESAALIKILHDQRKRVETELMKAAGEEWLQTPLLLDDERRKQDELERKQRRADMKYWEEWLANVDGDLDREPKRIRDFYHVKSHRLEPLGLVYLWPAA